MRGMSGKATRTPGERFWEKVQVGDFDECWLWQASLCAIAAGGYGRIYVDGRLVMAHRFAYEAFRGPIPAGLHIDHLCRVTRCVNPAHLEAVPKRVNTLRGMGPPAVNAAKTHCLSGHEFTPENTYVLRGRRWCRKCAAARERRYRAEQKTGPQSGDNLCAIGAPAL